MELAIEQSRREAFRHTRKQQDNEYERALKEAAEQEQQQQQQFQRLSASQPSIQEQNLLFPESDNGIISSGNNGVSSNNDNILSSGNDIGDEIGIGNDDDNDVYNIENQIELDHYHRNQVWMI